MLRWVIVLLVLANAGYFAWTQGYLDTLGMKPAEQREPQRLTQQVRPEALRLLNGPKADAVPQVPPAPKAAPPATPVTRAPDPTPEPVPAPTAPAPEPPPVVAPAAPPAADSGPRACWQAGGFTEAQAELLRAELALLGLASSASFTEVRSGGRWIVYMGRYDNQQQLNRKKDELRALGVAYRELTAPGLAPGLALGTYSTEAAAQQARQKTERDGIRTAKVAQERAESVSANLRLPSISESQRVAIEGLGEAMAGKRLQRCN